MTSLSVTGQKLLRQQQEALLVQAERFFPKKKVPKAVSKAFLGTPRHLFINRFYSSKKGRWVDLQEESVEDYLNELYADHPLGIYRDERERTLSTISQPTLVIFMLDLLQLEPGMNVFELGCGSGWNAAMIGRLVGPEGRVVTAEIIESLAASAKVTIESLGLRHVTVVAGDGSEGVSQHAPYQRGVFTASSWDLPTAFFEQIEPEGLLLLVIKIREGIDLLAVLRKRSDTLFESELHFPCSFVPVTGPRKPAAEIPTNIKDFATLEAEIAVGPDTFRWSQFNIDSEDVGEFVKFAELVHDCQTPYLVDNPDLGYAEEYSGIINENSSSLALFNEEGVKSYGAEDCLITLRRAAKRWLKAGKPDVEDLALSIHRSDTTPEPQQDQWIVPRGDCLLEWRFR